MKRSSQMSRSGLLLIEILMSILFFFIAGAICLLVFAKTRELADKSAAMEQAVLHFTSVESIVRTACDTSDSAIAACDSAHITSALAEDLETFLLVSVSDDTILIGYDRFGQNCDKADAAYLLSVRPAINTDRLLALSMDFILTKDMSSVCSSDITLFSHFID